MAEAFAEVGAMDSVSRAGPNLHYEEDWTYKLPDPQGQTGEWIHHNKKLQTTEDQFHRRTRDAFETSEGSPKKELIMG